MTTIKMNKTVLDNINCLVERLGLESFSIVCCLDSPAVFLEYSSNDVGHETIVRIDVTDYK